MSEKILEKFNEFVTAIDEKTKEFISIEGHGALTDKISRIQENLWMKYKEINGTSAGFHGISEYIVFSTIKNFIEGLNRGQNFRPIEINRDLRRFELKEINVILEIYRAASLRHTSLETTTKRAPDLAIIKKQNNKAKLVAIIEIKNYLDKNSAKSAVEMFFQIRHEMRDRTAKYALFSFSKVVVKDMGILNRLIEFQNNQNCFLITRKNDRQDIKSRDLSEFLGFIRNEVIL